MSDNAIVPPPFPWPPSLVALFASNNLPVELGELPEGLTQLVVNNNCLNQFPALPNDSLELVDISSNQIVKLCSQSLPALRKLRADDNLIQTLPDYLSDPESKIRLWLRNNPLSDETKTAIASANRYSNAHNDSQRIICDPANTSNPQPGFIHALSACFDRDSSNKQ